VSTQVPTSSFWSGASLAISARVGGILHVAYQPSMDSISLVAIFLAFSKKSECLKNDERVMIVCVRSPSLCRATL
jgi:hypothetical protein